MPKYHIYSNVYVLEDVDQTKMRTQGKAWPPTEEFLLSRERLCSTFTNLTMQTAEMSIGQPRVHQIPCT